MNEIIRKIDEEIERLNDKRNKLHQAHEYQANGVYISKIATALKIKAIIQAEQKEPTEEDLKERYYQAREIIKEFCQFEDCQDGDCKECPYPLSTIRCSEEWELKKRESKTNGDLIRESNESLAEFIYNITTSCITGKCLECKLYKACEHADNTDDIEGWLNQPVVSKIKIKEELK